MDKLLRRSQFIDSLPYRESKHFSEVKEGRFPEPIYFGKRMAFWAESEIRIMQEAYIRGASDDELCQISREIEQKRVSQGVDENE